MAFKSTFFGFSIIFPSFLFYKNSSHNKLNIIFDMDETILFTIKKDKYNLINTSNTNKNKYVESDQYYVYPRPYVYFALNVISKYNNLYLYTLGTKSYADSVLSKSDLAKYFEIKKYRHHYELDLAKCKNVNILVDKKDSQYKTILVDDKKNNQCENQDIYHIPKYNMYVKNDFELLKLTAKVLYWNFFG